MDKLSLYNGALLFIAESKLSALTDDDEKRHLLDLVFDRGGIKSVLQQGLWNFAVRTQKLEASTSITPSFGHQYAFDKPSDFVRTVEISLGERFNDPLLNYQQEGSYFFLDHDELYIRYVSNGSGYGGDYSLWPESFSRFAEAWFGHQISMKLKNRADQKTLKSDMRDLRSEARSNDAMEEPTRFPPTGSWVRSRGSGLSSSSDLGLRSRLTGR